MDEMNVEPIDFGSELRPRVELGLGFPPVVLGLPVTGELLNGRQLHALGAISYQLLGWIACRGDTTAEIFKGLLRKVDRERADCGSHGGCDYMQKFSQPTTGGPPPPRQST